MKIPKAELHVHLEGTLSPELAKSLAKKNKVPLPDEIFSPTDTAYLSRDFAHFLKVFDVVASVIKTPEDYYDLTLDYLKKNALDNVLYTEMMYSPDHAEKSSGIPSIEHLQAIQKAIDDAYEKYHIIGRTIIVAVRHFGTDAAIRVAKNIAQHSVPCVTGFGLGGDEINFPPKQFKKAYQIAYDAGLKCTVHAGEFSSADGILEAVTHLPVVRIGHGVQVFNAPDVIRRLIDLNIALELCPTSNIFLGLFPDMAHHPFPKLLSSGLQISINSDDPPFFDTTVNQEYEKVRLAYGYDKKQMVQITEMAIVSAFVDDKTRNELFSKIQGEG